MALVLTRGIGETLCIGDQIRVTIAQVQRGQVRLSIEAPDNVAVDRLEIYERKKRGLPPLHTLKDHL